jgi:hypothetical protein
MDKCYTTELIDGITMTTFFRKPDLSEVKTAMDEALSTGKCQLRLWELKEGISFSYEEIETIAEYAKKILPAPSKGAIIVTDDFSYGLMRVHDVHREQEQHETSVFKSKQDAIKWLKEGD